MIRLTHAQLQPIGLDIGHDSIKLLQLEVVGNALAVRAACERSLADAASGAPVADSGADDAESEERWTRVEELIRRMMREGGFSGRRVVAALPREIVHIKNHRLPPMPAPELEGAIQLEATHLFSFDPEQACIRCLPAGEVRQSNEVLQEIVVTAVLNEQIELFVERLHRCGLIVDSLDIEPCALYRTVDRFMRRREDEQEVHALVDVGFAGSRVVIGKGRDISFIKSIEMGGRHFQEAVAARLGIAPAEASALRRRLTGSPEGEAEGSGGSAPADPVRRAVFDAERGVMEQLGHELALCLRYQAVTFRGCRPMRLRLVGGEASNPNLHALLAAMLTIPVELARPLQNADTSRMKPAERRGTMAHWAVALGLGLRRTQQRFGARDGKPRELAGLAGGGDPPAQVPEVAAPATPAGAGSGKREEIHA